jgi:hypothetical protein
MSETPIEPDDNGFEQSENLDQMQSEDTLVDRGVDDVLDEGYSPAENWGPGEGFGSTADETAQGENLDQRVSQEEPDADPYADEDAQAPTDDEVGDARSGRLVDTGGGGGEDTEKDLVGDDVGIDGAAASAEEAAVHVVPDDDDD